MLIAPLSSVSLSYFKEKMLPHAVEMLAQGVRWRWCAHSVPFQLPTEIDYDGLGILSGLRDA